MRNFLTLSQVCVIYSGFWLGNCEKPSWEETFKISGTALLFFSAAYLTHFR